MKRESPETNLGVQKDQDESNARIKADEEKGSPETDLEVQKDQDELNVRINADKQKVSEADLEV